MTVKELIEKLGKCDRSAEVYVSNDRNLESGDCIVDVAWEMKKKEVTIVIEPGE